MGVFHKVTKNSEKSSVQPLFSTPQYYEKKNLKSRRSGINLTLSPHTNLRFKFAETKEELEAALRILHDTYVDSGFSKPHSSGMRVTPYHALPFTSTLLALWDNEIVGSVSAIRQNPFGLPIDGIFNTDKLKEGGRVIVEASGLSFRRDFISDQSKTILPLVKHFLHYCKNYLNADFLVLSTNPKKRIFFDKVLLMEEIDKTIVESYEFVNGAPAIGRFLDFHSFHQKLETNFGKNPINRNLFHYFAKQHFDHIVFPDRTYLRAYDPILTPEMFHYFFIEKTDVLFSLPEDKLKILHLLYANHKDILALLPPLGRGYETQNKRKQQRYSTYCGAEVVVGKEETIQLTVSDVSLDGFSGKFPLSFNPVYEPNVIHIKIGTHSEVSVTAQMLWRNKAGYCGFKLVDSSPQWGMFIESLDENFFKKCKSNNSSETNGLNYRFVN